MSVIIKEMRAPFLLVEDISDLWTFERIGFFRGMYHVLGGSLSAMNGIGLDELKINKLIQRINTT